MNDFTKEELETIFHNLSEIRENAEDLINPWPLLDKIQSMIDNHHDHQCNHEYVHVYTKPYELGSNYWKCLKCGNRKNDNFRKTNHSINVDCTYLSEFPRNSL